MNSYRKNIVKPICISLLILLGSSFVHATTQVSTQEQPISDMRILIDVSGSMKQNDPNNLRAPALKLLVGLLPNNSRAGVWTFGKEVNMQVKLDNVNDAWKKYARNEARNIHSFGLFTNIEDAISHATWDWKDPDPKYQRTLILLTDGVVDISRDAAVNKKSRQRVISKLLPKLNNAGVKINTIALSDNADHKLLQQLATRTNGWYSSVSSADELKRKFLHLFEKSTQADAIPLKDNSFTVDKSVSEMTVLIFKTDNSMPTELVTPDGRILTSESNSEELQWHDETGYDMITISKPVPGKWKAKAEIDPDNRVLVVTNLKLKSNKFTHNFLKGDIITIYSDLEEDNKIIKKQEFLKLVTFDLKINGTDNAYKLNDNGSIPDAKPQDGIFSSIIETSGLEESNDVLIEAKGATFNRQLRHSFKVFKSPVTLNVEEPEDGQPFDFSVTIKPYVFVKNSVNIHIELPDGKTLTAKPAVNQRWEVSIPANYQGNNIQISLEGKRYNQSGPYQYTESYALPSFVKEDVIKEELVKEEQEEIMEQPPVVLEKDVAVKEEPASPKEIAPPPPPVADKKLDETPAKKEEKQVTKTEAVVPEPEQEANWFVVFLIVLIGNVILISVTYFGYRFWKKKRNIVLAADNAVLEEDDAGMDDQPKPVENASEDDNQTIAAVDEDGVADDTTIDEPEAKVEVDSEQDKDADPLITDEDEDEGILMEQLGIEEDSDEAPELESAAEANDIVAESSDEDQQTPVEETPEGTEETQDIEAAIEADDTAESTSESIDSPVEGVIEEQKPEETIEAGTTNEAESTVPPIEEDEDLNPERGSELLMSDDEEEILKQQLGIEDESAASTESDEPVSALSTEETEDISEIEPSDELDETTNTESSNEPQENPVGTVAEAPEEETIEIDPPEVANEAEVAEPLAERDENQESDSNESQDNLDVDAILSDLDLEIDNMDEDDEIELDNPQKTEPARDAK